jgi:hypothetical protein
MDTNTVILSVLSALIGAFIGTYFAAHFINRKSENKIKEVRKIAIKALDIMKKYAKDKKAYCNANEQFNNELNIAEKRTILVCLHKMGIPIQMPVGKTFDIKKIQFLEKFVEKDEIEGMQIQINNGHCDHLFFMDVDKYFTEDTKIKTIRNIAGKFVREVLDKSKYDSNSNKLTYPENWTDKFSYGERQMIMVFWEVIRSPYYFDKQTGNPKVENTNQLIIEIENGLWDGYLQWDYDAYQNMLVQKKMAERFIDMSNYQPNDLQTQKSNY